MRVEQQRRRPRRGVAISDSEFDNDPCSCAGYDGYIDDDLGDLSRMCAKTIWPGAARRSGDRNNGMHDEPEAASSWRSEAQHRVQGLWGQSSRRALMFNSPRVNVST